MLALVTLRSLRRSERRKFGVVEVRGLVCGSSSGIKSLLGADEGSSIIVHYSQSQRDEGKHGNRKTLTLVVAPFSSWQDLDLAVANPQIRHVARLVLLGDGAEEDVRDRLLSSIALDIVGAEHALNLEVGEQVLDLLIVGVEVDIGETNNAAGRGLGDWNRSRHSCSCL